MSQRGPEYDSIFGRTYNGVPNPKVPHLHPYPTRYHGPIWTWPVFGHGNEPSWREQVYVSPSFLGLGAPPAGGSIVGTVLFASIISLPASLGAYYASTKWKEHPLLGAVLGGLGATVVAGAVLSAVIPKPTIG
jgi:hypothetical protein